MQHNVIQIAVKFLLEPQTKQNKKKKKKKGFELKLIEVRSCT